MCFFLLHNNHGEWTQVCADFVPLDDSCVDNLTTCSDVSTETDEPTHVHIKMIVLLDTELTHSIINAPFEGLFTDESHIDKLLAIAIKSDYS